MSSLSHPQATARLHPLSTSCPSCRSLHRGEPSTLPHPRLLSRALPVGLCPGPHEGAQPLLSPHPHPSPSQGSLGPRGWGCAHGCRRPPGPTAECREDKWLHGEGQHVRTTPHYHCAYTCILRGFSSRSGRSTVPGIRGVKRGVWGTAHK